MAQRNAASPRDDEVLESINACLAKDLRAQPGQVQVDVVDGQVTLTGAVDSSEARERAESRIRELPGVTYVLNNLRVAQAGTTGATG